MSPLSTHKQKSRAAPKAFLKSYVNDFRAAATGVPQDCCLVSNIQGLKRWDEGRWVKGSLVCTLLFWGLFPIPHLRLSHLLSPVTIEHKENLHKLHTDERGQVSNTSHKARRHL